MKAPAFQFYATDYLGSQRVQMLTLEEEGAYIRLLCSCWQHGSIPADPLQAARLVGKGASTTVVTVVLAMFQPGEPGRLVHDRLEAERLKQAEWREKSAAGGRKSAELRKGGSRVVEPPYQPKANIPSPSPSPSPVPISDTVTNHKQGASAPRVFIPPTPHEVSSYSVEIGYPLDGAVFCDRYAQGGWMVGKNKMRDWRAAVRNWKASGWTTGQRNGTHVQGANRHQMPAATKAQHLTPDHGGWGANTDGT